MIIWQCDNFHQSSRSKWSTGLKLKLTFHRTVHESIRGGQSRILLTQSTKRNQMLAHDPFDYVEDRL